MWKSGFSFTAATENSPQPNVEIPTFFHSPCGSKFCFPFFHRTSFHNPQPLWKTVELDESGVIVFYQLRFP